MLSLKDVVGHFDRPMSKTNRPNRLGIGVAIIRDDDED